MAESAEIKQLSKFLYAYAGLERSMIGFKIRKEKSELQQFLNGFSSIERLVQLQQKKVATPYNLFEILNIRHLEAKVHTPFLVDLLSPNGSHQQGNLFYQGFVKNVLPENDWNYYLAMENLLVRQEEGTKGLGRIDISIHRYHRHNPFVLIIENKIYAGDQEQQLARYYEFARSIRGLLDEQIRLIYLTKEGVLPSEHSLSSKEQKRLTKAGVLQCIGYQQHITAWLNTALLQVEAPVVRETISQYLKTLKTL